MVGNNASEASSSCLEKLTPAFNPHKEPTVQILYWNRIKATGKLIIQLTLNRKKSALCIIHTIFYPFKYIHHFLVELRFILKR